MNTGELDRLQAIFTAAKERAGTERAAYLDGACAEDAGLRAKVEAMLRHHDAAASGETVASAPPPSRRLGDRVGPFRIVDVLGVGGMGAVYRAEQPHPRREVALKVVRSGLLDPTAVRRFEDEANALARLRHPNIAQVHEAGTHDADGDPVPYFAMELVPGGRPLTAHARERGLDTAERLALFAKVCDAVHHGHQNGVIHRDVKPANILVDDRGEPKLIDFGIAKLIGDDRETAIRTQTGQLVGTLQYMSPEQCAGDPRAVDRRTDVYALGVVLYELLSDRRPYANEGRTVVEAVRIIQETEPPPPGTFDRSLRGDLDVIVAKAMSKDPARRYESASSLRLDIDHHLAGQPILARPSSNLYRMQRFVARHWLLISAAAAAAAFGAMLVVMVFLPELDPHTTAPLIYIGVAALAIPAAIFVMVVALQLAARWVVGERVALLNAFVTILIGFLALLPVNAVQGTVQLLAPQLKPLPALLAMPIQFAVFSAVVGWRLRIGFFRGVAVWAAVCAMGLAIAVFAGVAIGIAMAVRSF